MTTYEERVDELVALACDAGRLGADAARAEHDAFSSRDPRVRRRARDARAEATLAEQKLSAARARFLKAGAS